MSANSTDRSAELPGEQHAKSREPIIKVAVNARQSTIEVSIICYLFVKNKDFKVIHRSAFASDKSELNSSHSQI